jgi:tryptophan synthase alpha subunit
VDAKYAADLTADEAVSALAMADPVNFAARLSETVSESGLDPVDLAAPGLEADAVQAVVRNTHTCP